MYRHHGYNGDLFARIPFAVVKPLTTFKTASSLIATRAAKQERDIVGAEMLQIKFCA